MTVRRRKDRKGTYVVDVKIRLADGSVERVRRTSPVQTRRGAEQFERQIREEILNPTPEVEQKEVPTLNAFADEFIETYAETNNKPSEVESKRSILNIHLTPILGRLRLDRIGLREIEKYKSRKLKEGLAKKTVNNHLTVLRRLLAVAVEWELISHVPQIKWLKAPKPDFDFLTFEEAEQLLEGAEVEWWCMIFTALRTGLRLGELLALRWEDIDLPGGRLIVRQAVARGIVGTPKSHRPREVPLSDKTVQALREHRHLKGELVFSQPDGTMLTRNMVKHPLWRACKAAELRPIGWHVARHSYASHLVMLGVPLKHVQEYLGHATIEMTMRYAHLSPEAKREGVQLLDRVQERGTMGAPNQPSVGKVLELH
ncbi:tyrosine-type recombinase/integrase [Myxococcota bacterium]